MTKAASGSPSLHLSNVFDLFLKFLSVLVIPLTLWGVRLEVTNALQDERIVEMRGDIAKFSDISQKVHKVNLLLTRLEEKINNVDAKIRNVGRLLPRTNP